MTHITHHPWHAALLLGKIVASHYTECVLLHSGILRQDIGRYSLLAFDKITAVENNFHIFADALSSDKATYDNSWFGYIGYDVKHQFETLPHDKPGWLNFPQLWMAQFRVVLIFDHHKQRLTSYSQDAPFAIEALLEKAPQTSPYQPPKLEFLASNMSQATYLDNVEAILAHIRAGDVYQANLTRKFYGEFTDSPNGFALFEQLCALSPAPYSAYIGMGGQAVLSSSPEQFIKVGADGSVSTRPIKGSATRYAEDIARDHAAKEALSVSEKDRAENLMIVDLCRNDLSRGCEVGSVKVEKLFDIESYATIHHMVSTVMGQKKSDVLTADMIGNCFPPGSMTGAPKIKAMEICTALEQQARGVYSGAIGWCGGDGSADLSVVIRTLLIEGNRFEFQVGGAIVMDSDPQKELEETFTKARAICSLLGVSCKQLEQAAPTQHRH
jgi:para-aminobenzoate synthetase component 1